MTPRQSGTVKLTLAAVVLIFGMGVAWRELKGDINEKLPEKRFLADSSRRDGVNSALLSNQYETNRILREMSDRMLEVCVYLKGRAGCR